MESYIWFGLLVVFSLVEIAAPGLVSIWFAMSAGILTFVSKYLSVENQIYLFVGLSAVFLIVTRPLAKKMLSSRQYKIEDRILGQIVVIEKIFENGDCEVKLDGKYWKCKSSTTLEVGSRGKVTGIEGNKLILEKE